MQLELAEECHVHRPCDRTGELIQLINTTSLPQPPNISPIETLGSLKLNADFESWTWYYYLAETSSRQLVERIKEVMYSGKL